MPLYRHGNLNQKNLRTSTRRAFFSLFFFIAAIPSASANLSLECSGTNIYNCTLRWEHPPNIKNTSLLMYCFNITKESGDVVVQDVCTKATQYSFAVSHLDWCDSYKVTSTSSCNMAIGNTTTVALKPTGTFLDLSIYRNTEL